MRAFWWSVFGMTFAGALAQSCSFSSLDDLKNTTAGPDGGGTSGTNGVDAQSDVPWACVPKSCKTADADCGQIADGCNGTVDCGLCPEGKVCGGAGPNHCGDKPCTPKTCAALGATCGTASDGCGSTLDCGTCTSPKVCNPSNQCECVPQTCASQAVQCGQAPDGCGTTLECGSCPTNYSCAAGKCNCVPKTCAQLGWTCGILDDGCGGQVSCGACSGVYSCLNHACVQSAVMFCGGCPAGFNVKKAVSNNGCGFQSFCGQSWANYCVLAGIDDASGCGVGCTPGYHSAGNVDDCTCNGGFWNTCLHD